ncbi:hypothetical protein Y032_0612g651 [Ancylostoma ceylanicum]|uniref:CCHC-type domain-containing protein n=2 Tax=Ancylostoma ceylanicum TaxID=53326 RepID=A0A016WN06_9BILA|nr:hypothetical protein Y032_0612g651 [Ancylostoma ceylanicum]
MSTDDYTEEMLLQSPEKTTVADAMETSENVQQEEHIDSKKAEILFRQLARWNGSYSLSEAIETSRSGEAYENVKRAALRLERNRRAVAEMSQSTDRKMTPRPQSNRSGDSQFERFNNINGDRGRPSNHTQPSGTVEAMTHNRLGRSSREVTQSRPQNATTDKGVVECYSCGKRGHMAKDCRFKPVRQREESTRPRGGTSERQAGSFSALVDKLVGSVSMSKEFRETQGLFGSKSLAPITVMDREVTALLDTGSEASIVPLGVFRDARADGVDLDVYVQRIPRIKAIVRDASGVVMDFVETIRMPVTLQGATKSVAFHVSQALEGVIILGTNALECSGLNWCSQLQEPA